MRAGYRSCLCWGTCRGLPARVEEQVPEHLRASAEAVVKLRRVQTRAGWQKKQARARLARSHLRTRELACELVLAHTGALARLHELARACTHGTHVDGGTADIVDDIGLKDDLGCHGLEVEATLLLNEADVVRNVARNDRAARLLAGRSIVGRSLVGAAP